MLLDHCALFGSLKGFCDKGVYERVNMFKLVWYAEGEGIWFTLLSPAVGINSFIHYQCTLSVFFVAGCLLSETSELPENCRKKGTNVL